MNNDPHNIGSIALNLISISSYSYAISSFYSVFNDLLNEDGIEFIIHKSDEMRETLKFKWHGEVKWRHPLRKILRYIAIHRRLSLNDHYFCWWVMILSRFLEFSKRFRWGNRDRFPWKIQLERTGRFMWMILVVYRNLFLLFVWRLRCTLNEVIMSKKVTAQKWMYLCTRKVWMAMGSWWSHLFLLVDIPVTMNYIFVASFSWIMSHESEISLVLFPCIWQYSWA